MRKVLLGVFYGLLGLFLIVVAGGYALPGAAHVERSAVMNAPAEKIYAIVSDLQRNREWSPWVAIDPAIELTFSGPNNGAPGVGQKMSWLSKNPQVGTGWQEVTELVPNEKFVSALNFSGNSATATMQLAPGGTGTKVTWGFDATLSGVAERWFGLFFDRLIGPDFEAGLANLKRVAETQG
jgi:Polyketide cyclase / dehydrase and lipid transport